MANKNDCREFLFAVPWTMNENGYFQTFSLAPSHQNPLCLSTIHLPAQEVTHHQTTAPLFPQTEKLKSDTRAIWRKTGKKNSLPKKGD